jgi:hybrid cluster-associated redox disulfide protein
VPRMTKQMLVGEALRLHPSAGETFFSHGMACAQCMEAVDETIEDAARMHGVSVDQLLHELNALVEGDERESTML